MFFAITDALICAEEIRKANKDTWRCRAEEVDKLREEWDEDLCTLVVR